MLYRVVVVEDDRIIRKAIVQSDWAKIHAEVVGEAADGQQALEVIQQTNPHLIVTDINMPFMNGIALAKKLRETNTAVRIIFLTGYDDFEYVHEAMLLKSDDYLLKPVNQEKLFEKAEKALASWQQEQEKTERLQESLPLLQQKFLSRLLFYTGSEGIVDIQQELYRLRIYLTGPHFMVMHVFLPNYEREQPIYQLLSRWERQNEVEVLSYQNNEVFLFLSVTPNQVDWITDLRNEIQTSLEEELGQTVYVTTSSSYAEMQDFDTAILEAKVKMERLKIEGYVAGRTNEASDSAGPDEEMLERTKAFLELLTTNPFSLSEAKRLSFNLVTYLCAVLNRTMQDESQQVSVYKVSQQVMKAESIEQVIAVIQPLVHCWEAKLEQQKQEQLSDSLVQKALHYMREHYMEPDLSLVKLSQEIHVTAPYLSNLFKAETGKNFTEYLLEMKMEKAKELLVQTNMKTYEVAEQVGYLNPHYFSSSFKKYTGKTPVEFRKKQRE